MEDIEGDNGTLAVCTTLRRLWCSTRGQLGGLMQPIEAAHRTVVAMLQARHLMSKPPALSAKPINA